MWTRLGKSAGRPDMAAHGAELLAVAPKLRAAIQASIAKTTTQVTVGGKQFTCVRNGEAI